MITINEHSERNSDYQEWLRNIKARLQQSQVKAFLKVNNEMLRFYWSLGRDIVSMNVEQHWGKGFFNRLSLDLKEEFPNLKGFSVTNLKYMKRWYLFYYQYFKIRYQVGNEFPEVLGKIPWRHHTEILRRTESVEEALFYIEKTIEDNWSRRQLEDYIESKLYYAKGKAVTNFQNTLPATQGNLAQELLKDPYNFDFLSITKGYNEKQLETALTENITKFLLELGKGFAFVGRQIELKIDDNKSYYLDMLFYHIRLKCYVVVELKVVDFEPEFAGKLNFYVTATDKLLKKEDDNPSIGLLICKTKNNTIVEWAFQNIQKPLGVSTFELQQQIPEELQTALPSIEEIEKEIQWKSEES